MSGVASARRRRRQAGAALFLVSFALVQALLWYAYYAHGAKALIGDEQSYQQAALAILAGGPWMASTIWPPLQPLLLAAVYGIAGVHLLAAQLVQGVLFVLCGVLLRDLWRRLGGSVRAANGAAALFLLDPSTAAYAQWLWPEVPHLFLLLAALCLLARTAPPLRAGAAGACVGLAILAKSLLAAFWPVPLLVFVRRARPHLATRAAAAYVAALALVTAPALVHGWREYGRPMIADSSVYNLWIGLTDQWRSDYIGDMGGITLPAFLASGATPQARNAVYLDKVRALVDARGAGTLLADQLGRQYFRLFSAKTPLLSQLPGAACAGHLSAYRTPLWLTRTLTVASDLAHALILAAAAFGLARWRRRGERGVQALWLLLALFAAYQLALFAFIHVKARFLLPLLPFAGGFAADVLCERRGDAVLAPASPSRLVLGALLAALLLGLAFGGPLLDHACAA